MRVTGVWVARIVLAAVTTAVASCGGAPPVDTQDPGGPFPPHRQSRTGPVEAPKPSDIAGKTPTTVRALLGAPTLTRREPPAEVWQYAGGACVIDIVFYPPGQAGGLRASHLDSRDLDGAAMPPVDCLGLLAREGNGP